MAGLPLWHPRDAKHSDGREDVILPTLFDRCGWGRHFDMGCGGEN
jgi:hypothetical protein